MINEEPKKKRGGSKPKPICKRGHNTLICGRTRNGQCKICKHEEQIKYRQEHKEELRLKSIKYREEHKEEIKKKTGENKEAKQEYDRMHYQNNKEKIKQQKKVYYAKNFDAIIANKRIYQAMKIRTDIQFKLKTSLRDRIIKAIHGKQKKGSAVRDLGCSIEFLKAYLESKFYVNIAWDNWGVVWELDHVTPLFKFDLTDRTQFLEACHYTNLQPLTIEDHRKKTAKELSEKVLNAKSK